MYRCMGQCRSGLCCLVTEVSLLRRYVFMIRKKKKGKKYLRVLDTCVGFLLRFKMRYICAVSINARERQVPVYQGEYYTQMAAEKYTTKTETGTQTEKKNRQRQRHTHHNRHTHTNTHAHTHTHTHIHNASPSDVLCRPQLFFTHQDALSLSLSLSLSHTH
jgi:hypothetical protein